MQKIKVENRPKIFHVNWFRTDEDGNFIWPGFGDNMRVLDWILRRCEGTVDAVETPIGYMPKPEDINLEGLDFTIDQLKSILDCDIEVWKEEADKIEEYFDKTFGDTLPKELRTELNKLKKNLEHVNIIKVKI